ncbi:hypothetical protein FA95DRAFT_1582762 [Auriscalpium vulgare]|uniref:Uncharacterized protein n=1 Tax=Auriscalpium vulgare TaxID=40419 RepID=A0ACB8RTK8_9AGAM|nr:hypothetical protein FA95DRAFT_1582762 [Auriscalpium vulgare]
MSEDNKRPSAIDSLEHASPPALASAASELYVASPSPPIDEPEGPNPFLVDDPEDPLSPEPPTPRLAVHPSSSQVSVAAAVDISLSAAASPYRPPVQLPSVNVNKPVPAFPPAPSSDTESEPDAPAVYLPQLVQPTMFLPIPNTDPLTTLLTKFVANPEKRPKRDLTGEWTRSDFQTLVHSPHAPQMTNSWRALARMARDRIVEADPEDLPDVLNLWSLRLSCLSRMRLFNQTTAETTNLFTVLSAVEPPTARAYVFDTLLPFELEVLQARVRYWSGDPRGYTDALGALLRKCRRKARQGDREMWAERGARVALIAASQFVETKDFTAATRLLEPLLAQPDPTHELRSAVGRIYLQAGQLAAAERHFAAVARDPAVPQPLKDLNAAFLASARGDWARANAILGDIVDRDPENFSAVNNLGVALLGEGKLKEGIDVLETAFHAAPSTLAMAEPFLFNLSTLYELRSAVAADKKRELLIEVAKWSGDGLRTTCLKMPTN